MEVGNKNDELVTVERWLHVGEEHQHGLWLIEKA